MRAAHTRTVWCASKLLPTVAIEIKPYKVVGSLISDEHHVWSACPVRLFRGFGIQVVFLMLLSRSYVLGFFRTRRLAVAPAAAPPRGPRGARDREICDLDGARCQVFSFSLHLI